jgi:DNA polymerase epsilon subunit 1
MYQGRHLIESETYVGGHVEALESGVFRSDLGYKFNLDPGAIDQLIAQMDTILQFGIEVEGGIKKDTITNYEEVKKDIISKLEALKATPRRKENPVIYHLDVMAMYPNIILTNRLQPSAVVTEEDCASCIHNRPESNCKRDMTWVWRGDFVPANRSEYELIKTQLETERFPDPRNVKDSIGFYELSAADQQTTLKQRLKDYSKKVYKTTHKTVEEDRVATICQRENPFYVDTVKAFRDRRYIYKEKLKEANKGVDKAKKESQSQAAINDAQKLVVLYDSLQLAHKCILNSFYGYVMAKGSRWFSMEMAGAGRVV